MPLMMLNLRALPNGLDSHKQFLKEEVESWLTGSGKLEEADVTFICSAVESENCTPVKLAGHQAVLAPVSEVLRQMFEMSSCSHVRSMVYITMDCDPKVNRSAGSLIQIQLFLRFYIQFFALFTTAKPSSQPALWRR